MLDPRICRRTGDIRQSRFPRRHPRRRDRQGPQSAVAAGAARTGDARTHCALFRVARSRRTDIPEPHNESSTMTNIAFIGLGNMGGPMAANLVKAGHKVVAFDLVEASKSQARSDGATIAESAAAAVRG